LIINEPQVRLTCLMTSLVVDSLHGTCHGLTSPAGFICVSTQGHRVVRHLLWQLFIGLSAQPINQTNNVLLCISLLFLRFFQLWHH